MVGLDAEIDQLKGECVAGARLLDPVTNDP